MICLTTRPSRLTGRSELLLLQAFSNRVGEILVGGSSDEGPLQGLAAALPDRLVGGQRLRLAAARPAAARPYSPGSRSTSTAASTVASIGATSSMSHRSSTRRIGASAGTTSRSR